MRLCGMSKEVEGLRTFAGQTMEEAERGLDEVKRLLNWDLICPSVQLLLSVSQAPLMCPAPPVHLV